MKTFQLLKPLPVIRSEEHHVYYCKATKQYMAWSTTEVCSELTAEDKESIEFHRAEWQPRGEKIHECLQEFMLGSDDIDMGDYSDWVIPLLDHELFKNFEPMAVEYMMTLPDKKVGGQLDLLGYDTKTRQIRLIDLKSKKNTNHGFYKRERDGLKYIDQLERYWKEPYSTDKQLGCYVEMLKVNKDIVPDVCNTIWAYPDVCIIGFDQPVERCTDAWNKAWEKFQSKQEQF